MGDSDQTFRAADLGELTGPQSHSTMRQEEDLVAAFEGDVDTEKGKIMNALILSPGNRASFDDILSNQVGS